VSRAAESPRATALISGGSLAGLAADLELRAAAPRVSVHERSERVLDDRGAGIVLQPDTQQLLSERCGWRERSKPAYGCATASIWVKMERRNFTSSCRNK
jgi:2-polyprenyl-6-methoxyphenol hydroxylase-like FAD-dependent oxidoreductase